MRMIKYSENELIPDIIIDFDEWNNHSGIYLIIEKAVKHTLRYINNIEYKELSVLLTSNKNITALNKRFRDINKATNILWDMRTIELDNITKLTIPTSPYELNDGRQVLILNGNFYDFATENLLIDE